MQSVGPMSLAKGGCTTVSAKKKQKKGDVGSNGWLRQEPVATPTAGCLISLV